MCIARMSIPKETIITNEEEDTSEESEGNEENEKQGTHADGLLSTLGQCIGIRTNKKNKETQLSDPAFRKDDVSQSRDDDSTPGPTSKSQSTHNGSEKSTERKNRDITLEYDVTNVKRGVAVLIINSAFENESENRKSACVDKNRMRDVFRKLDFNVKILENKTTSDLFRDLREIRKELDEDFYNNISCDCFACVISSHGCEIESATSTEHYFCTYRAYDKVKTGDILSIFDGHNCESLRGKPKLFIIQACRSLKKPIEEMVDKGTTMTITTDLGQSEHRLRQKDSDAYGRFKTQNSYKDCSSNDETANTTSSNTDEPLVKGSNEISGDIQEDSGQENVSKSSGDDTSNSAPGTDLETNSITDINKLHPSLEHLQEIRRVEDIGLTSPQYPVSGYNKVMSGRGEVNLGNQGLHPYERNIQSVHHENHHENTFLRGPPASNQWSQEHINRSLRIGENMQINRRENRPYMKESQIPNRDHSAVYTIPVKNDFIIAVATTPGTIAWSENLTGGWLISSFRNVILDKLEINGKYDIDIVRALTETAAIQRNMNSYAPGKEYHEAKAACVVYHKLRKYFILRTKFKETLV